MIFRYLYEKRTAPFIEALVSERSNPKQKLYQNLVNNCPIDPIFTFSF